MIEQIISDGVVTVDTRDDWLDIELVPEERAALGQAVERRRREFITARACARRALMQLGIAISPIAMGEHGQPLWPASVVGSITHCAGYRACALAPAAEFAGVGIDAEPNEPLPKQVLGEIARAEERIWLTELARTEPAVHWDRLLFSAKETVYKTWFPIAERWLGFDDAIVTLDTTRKIFHARLLTPQPLVAGEHALTTMEGRWLIRDGLILTAIALRTL